VLYKLTIRGKPDCYKIGAITYKIPEHKKMQVQQKMIATPAFLGFA